MINRRQWVLSSAAVAFPALLPLKAAALVKSARIVVGFPPGGSADLIARALSLQLGGYASSVIVDNKPGAGGRIALEALKNAEPDGSTFVITPASMVSLYPHVYKKLSYDPFKDFTPVAVIASFPFVLVVGPLVPAQVKTVADFISWCKANPKLAAYASSGNGSIPHFAGVALSRAAQVDLTHVAYKGGAPAMNDVLGGQIAANIAVISNAIPLLQAGKLRALAVTGLQRSAALPDVPTLVEAGYRDVNVTDGFFVFLPAKASPEMATRLNAALRDAMGTKAVQEVLAKASFEAAAPASPAEFARLLKSETERWGTLVKASGFTPED
jgi:tripartite-type tricarboxylate transporter receptor subunit TctC